MYWRIYAIYHFVRHDLWTGLSNLILFLPVIWRFKPWDYMYTLDVFDRCLKCQERYLLKHGHEVDEHRIPRVWAIRKFRTLFAEFQNADYTPAGQFIWTRMWDIVKGEDPYNAKNGHDMRGWWD